VNDSETSASINTPSTQECSADVPLGWVYFIRVSGAIKIGYATNIAARFSQIQTCNPHPIELLGKMPGTLEDESKAHVRFRHLALRAEWFRDHEDIREFARRRTPKPKSQPKKRKLRPRVPEAVAQWLRGPVQ
jgi:hypothetical protein